MLLGLVELKMKMWGVGVKVSVYDRKKSESGRSIWKS